MLRNRCDCGRFVETSEKLCPKCGAHITTNYYLIKNIGNKQYKKRLGQVSKQEALYRDRDWNPLADIVLETLSIEDVKKIFLQKLTAEGKGYAAATTVFFDRLLWFAGGNKSITLITPETARKFQIFIRERVGPATTDRHIAMMKAAWNYCLPDKPNPWKRVAMYNPDNTKIAMLSPEQEGRLLEAARKHPHLYGMVAIAMNTGLRLNEILSITKDSIDFENRFISGIGKGKKKFYAPINDRLLPIVQEYYDNAADLLFPSPVTGVKYNNITKAWTRAKKEAGIPSDFRFHDLRHNFAIAVGKACGDTHVVSKLLNHSSVAVTEKHYRHIIDSEKLRAVNLLNHAYTCLDENEDSKGLIN